MLDGHLPSIIETLWFILPAWIANSVAIDVKGLPILRKYGTPVDFGKSVRGKRILGDGKTWRGLICGSLAAGLTGYLMGSYHVDGFIRQSLKLGLLLGFGALFGDMVESFIKRRSGLDRGHPLFLMDHLDYVFGACFFAWTMVPLNLGYLFMAALITVPIHFFANIVAWGLKLKKKPW